MINIGYQILDIAKFILITDVDGGSDQHPTTQTTGTLQEFSMKKLDLNTLKTIAGGNSCHTQQTCAPQPSCQTQSSCCS